MPENDMNILSEIGELINSDDDGKKEVKTIENVETPELTPEENWGDFGNLETIDSSLDLDNLEELDELTELDLNNGILDVTTTNSDEIGVIGETDSNNIISNEKEIRELYDFVQENAKAYDMMRTSEAILRTELMKRRYNSNIELEKQFIDSLNTISYSEKDLDKVNAYYRWIQGQDSITPNQIYSLIDINDSVKVRVDELMNELITTDRIGLDENLSEDSIYKILNLLDIINQEISLTIKDSKGEKEMAFEFGQYNKPSLEPSVEKRLKTAKVLYLTNKITEIVNSNLNYDNERRKYYKIFIKRALVLDDSLTTKEIDEKFPEEITITYSTKNKDANMCLYSIRNSSLRNLYKQVCDKKDIEAKEYVLKPFFLLRNESLVLFSKLYYYTDFINQSVKNLMENNVTTSQLEWYKSVELNSEYHNELFEKEELEIGAIYKTYTNQEIESYLKDYITTNRIKKKFDLLRVTTQSFNQTNTYCRNILLNIVYEYVDKHQEQTGNLLNSDDIFKMYQPRIVLEYILKSLSIMKYYVNRNKIDEFKEPDFRDLLSFFQDKNGLIDKLGLEDLSLESIKAAILDENNKKHITLDALYVMPPTVGVKKSYIKKNRYKSSVLNRTFEKAQRLLKTFDEKINFNNVLQIIDGNNTNQDNNTVESGEKFMVNDENFRDSHKQIVKYIITSIFNHNGIEDEDSFADTLAEKYIDSIKESEMSNIKDAHIFLRNNHSVEVNDNVDSTGLKKEFILININRHRLGLGLADTTCLIDSLNNGYLKEKYPNIENIDFEKYKDSEFIKDLNKIILFSEELKSVVGVADSILSNLTEDYIIEYKPGVLLNKISINTKEPILLENEIWVGVDGNNLHNYYNIKDIYKGVNESKPFTIIRDEAFLTNLFSDRVFKVYKKEKPNRFYNIVQNLFETTLMDQKEDLSETFAEDKEILGFNIQKLLEDVEYKLKCICPSNIDMNYIITDLKKTLYYQSSGFVDDEVKSNLQEYKYSEVDKEYLEISEITLMGKYIAALSDILGFNLSIYYTKQMNNRIDEIKSGMKKLSASEMYSFTPSADRRRANALYKAYLNSQNKKMLKDVNRDLVDMELLIQEPKADGSGGGEFSRYNLIKEYELEEKTLSPEDSNDLDYFYTILTIEKYNPEIYDTLPRPIIEYMEKGRVLEDRYKNDDLFKTTRFKLKIK